MSTTFVGVGVSVAADRDDGTLRRLSGTPLPAAGYLARKASRGRPRYQVTSAARGPDL